MDYTVPNSIKDKYIPLLDKAKSVDERKIIIDKADKEDNIEIVNNSGFIAQAERQSVNAIIQGGSATITKRAINDMCNNQELKDLDFHLLVPVHDEVIAEAPLWNIERCNELMGQIMCDAAKPECVVEMKTDGDTFDRWYSDVAYAHLRDDFEKLVKQHTTKEEAFRELCEDNCEFLPDEIQRALGDLL